MLHAILEIDTSGELLLLLLLAGHVVSDFLLQTTSIAERKGERIGPLLLHGSITTGAHLVLVLPFWSPPLIVGILLLGLVHTGLDAAKGRIERRTGRSLRLFFADQLTHLASIFALWFGLTRLGATAETLLPLDPSWIPDAAGVVLVGTGLIFNGKGGTAVVRLVLERFPRVVPRDEEGYNMGRTIGVLERLLLFILVLLDQWGALGLVLAAKSIARFKELSHQPFADYYLIGTLTSILVAIVSGVLVRAFLLG